MLRVLHLRSSAGWAGPERHLVELATALRRESVAVTLAVLDPRIGERPGAHPLVTAARAEGLDAFALPAPRGVCSGVVASLADRLTTGGFDLLHSHDYKSNWLGRRAARRAAIPTVATVHLHTRASLRLRLYHRLDRRELRRFDAVLAVAAALRRDLPPTLRNGRQPLVVHNGLDADRLRRRAAVEESAARAEWGTPAPEARLLAVGRLAAQKGFDLLLQAVARLRPRWPGLRVSIVGSGPERECLERSGWRLGLGSVVAFPGERADVAGRMRAADLVVVPSRREGLPYVALEAMALGRPVVASAVGGVPELIADRESGWLCEPGSVASLSSALARALEVPELRRRVAEKGRERVEQDFAAQGMAAANAAVYRELVA